MNIENVLEESTGKNTWTMGGRGAEYKSGMSKTHSEEFCNKILYRVLQFDWQYIYNKCTQYVFDIL